MDSNERAFNHVSPDKPSAARIYDYLLGGYHNFEIDRAAAQQFMAMIPDVPLFMQANRAFLRRVVTYLADQGIDQFLDIGSGIPTVGNVHEVAQNINAEARVVYVDAEPIAVRHSNEILTDNPNATAIQADARQPELILNNKEVRHLLDLDKPTAVLLLSVLLFITDDEETYGIVRTLRDALAPGSYVAISHPTEEGLPPEDVEQSRLLYAAIGSPVRLRGRTEIERYFEGLELVEPGLVHIPLWRPEGSADLFLDQPELAQYYGGVGRKP